MPTEFSAAQRETLKALCDTFVPSIEETNDPGGFWKLCASDVSAHLAVEQYINTKVPEPLRTGLLMLLEPLTAMKFAQASQPEREAVIQTIAASSPEAGAGMLAYQQLTLMFSYALPDQTGRNPFWQQLNYPGPLSAPVQVEKTIKPTVPTGDTTLEADVVVVGSGAGGGVIAGELAMQGKKVVVLEMGGYYNEADFNQLELWGYENLYYKGGFFTSADGNISIAAGSTLGGGTTVNWSNCVRPRDDIRQIWAQQYGLEGVDGPDFDRHIDTVLARIGANDQCSDYNGPHQRLAEGAAKRGYEVKKAALNIDPEHYDAAKAGHTGFGDQTGAKQSTTKTFLQDAFNHKAQILVRTKAEKILVENGQAVGVEATYNDGTHSAKVTVKAKQVVVACGALETPALLLRSGIGGPAVGKYLRLHPTGVIIGIYADEQKAWWGPAQASIVKQFADVEAGHGFIIEISHFTTGLFASITPWESGRGHKERMTKAPYTTAFINITQDHGHGQVVIDADGNAVHYYPFNDELDQRNFRRGLTEMIRLHEAAGAQEIHTPVAGVERWKRGDDLETFIQQVVAIPLGAGGQPVFTAHQMGSARMGNNPETSVANPYGELHDVKGVWIGDTSAFPTCSGGNPMVSCMALAHRTAEYIAAAMAGQQSPKISSSETMDAQQQRELEAVVPVA